MTQFSERHAYLVMAHEQPHQLQTLLALLDDAQNDLFVHIDKKAAGFDENALRQTVRCATLRFVPRMDVVWGATSQMRCEISLLSEAVKTEHAYYHLLSGADLPLQKQETIRAFFRAHSGKEFLSFSADMIEPLTLDDRLRTYHVLRQRCHNRNRVAACERYTQKIQRMLGVNRLKGCALTFQKGGNWFSITHAFAVYALNALPAYERYFRLTKCVDEVFLQTICVNSPFRDSLFVKTPNENRSVMRLVDWERGGGSSPYIFRSADFDTLVSSDMLFARKFSERVDAEIIERVAAYVGRPND